jgi:hypothetical protein
MKHLKMVGFGLTFTFFCIMASAQADRLNEPNLNKPRLFDAISNDVTVNTNQLVNILNYEVGQTVNITLSPGFQFQGQVVSTANKYENTIQSIVIASSNFNGARFTFTKVIDADKNITYTGRIISFEHGDLFELVNRNNQYYLVKKKFYDLVNE